MDKKRVALMLKNKRALAGLSVQDVVAQLKIKGFTLNEKTLYGYENGISSPNVPLFIALCDIYQIDDIIYEVSGSSPAKNRLSIAKASTEDWAIDQYNDSDADQANLNRLSSLFLQLNESAQGRLIERAETMVEEAQNLKALVNPTGKVV